MLSNENAQELGSYELNQQVSPSTLDLKALPKVAGLEAIQSDQQPEQTLSLVNGEIPDELFVKAEEFHRSYRAHAKERMAHLKSIYQELEEPETLVIILFCKSYFPLFKNWLASCNKNGIRPQENLIAFCLDNESAKNCQKLGIRYYFFDPETYQIAGGAKQFGDEKFRATMLYKNAIILDALQLGANILFQDVDLVWFKDPIPLLENQGQYYDIQIMFDGLNPRYKPLYCNSGFIFIRPTDASKAVFETALRNSACILKSGGHQYALVHILNYFLKNKLMRLHILPEHLFMNGHLLNTNGGTKPNVRNWKNHGIVFHYSWTNNIRQKVDKLKKFDMCYLDPEDIDLQNAEESYRKVELAANKKSNSIFMKNQEIEITLHIKGQEPLELCCYSNDPIVGTLFRSFFSLEATEKNSEVIHLCIIEDDKPCDIFIRASDIKLIKTSPPLSVDALNKFTLAD